jgi:CspA family cold shock protein
MNKGKVKWYNEAKGFGFIESEGMDDIFVHRSGLTGQVYSLNTDDKVLFEVKKGDKGFVAVNVKIDS